MPWKGAPNMAQYLHANPTEIGPLTWSWTFYVLINWCMGRLIKALLTNTVPHEHVAQLQHQLPFSDLWPPEPSQRIKLGPAALGHRSQGSDYIQPPVSQASLQWVCCWRNQIGGPQRRTCLGSGLGHTISGSIEPKEFVMLFMRHINILYCKYGTKQQMMVHIMVPS